jgi:hypothetical protein
MSIFDFFKSKKPKNLLEEFESTALPLSFMDIENSKKRKYSTYFKNIRPRNNKYIPKSRFCIF